MKNRIAILIFLLITISCTDDKKNTLRAGNKIDQSKNDSYLSAKVDGNEFYSKELNYFSAQNIITLAAVSKDKTEKIRMYINYKNGPTTYTFGIGISNSDNMVYTNNKVDWLAAKTKGKGTITFTKKGNYLLATFSFTGVNKETQKTIQITNGKFKVRIDS